MINQKKINFDEDINRHHTRCIKWDTMPSEETLPLWIADMDFKVADEITQALKKRIEHPIFGYTISDNEEKQAFADHFNNYCSHNISTNEIILSTGVVYSINACIQLLSEKNDKIIIHSPAYPPFRNVSEENGRTVIESKMILKDGQYQLDFDDLEKQVDEHCKILILCNPHNPGGHLFSKKELEKIADFAQRHHLLIFADEIHADFIFDNRKFIPIMELNEYTLAHTITFVSCTKTFNLAGLNISAVFVKNRELYEKINAYLDLNGLTAINIFGLEAMKAAYTKSEYWREQLISYLQENRDFICDYLDKNLPAVNYIKNEATYLMWLDLSNYPSDDIYKYLLKKGHLCFNNGIDFGKSYKNYVRLNFACPKSQLEKALNLLKESLNPLLK